MEVAHANFRIFIIVAGAIGTLIVCACLLSPRTDAVPSDIDVSVNATYRPWDEIPSGYSKVCDVSIRITIRNKSDNWHRFDELYVSIYDPKETATIPVMPEVPVSKYSASQFPVCLLPGQTATIIFSATYPISDQRRYEIRLSDGIKVLTKGTVQENR